MQPTWILIGDGSHARLFQCDDATQDWRLVREDDREHSREKTSDAPVDRGEQGFAKQLAGELETGRQAGEFQRLVLVAPPKFLGQLRAELSPSLAACVVNSVDADYTQVPAGELPKRIDLG